MIAENPLGFSHLEGLLEEKIPGTFSARLRVDMRKYRKFKLEKG